MIKPPQAGWPCPACGRDRPVDPCICGEAGPIRAELFGARPFRRVAWSCDAGRAQADRRRGGSLANAAGVGRVRRPWRGPEWASFRAGAEHLTGDELDPDWWNGVHLRDGVVLGVPTPTQARVAFALVTGLVGCLARKQVWAVIEDRRHWRRDGAQRSERVDRAGGGVFVARSAGSAREADLEGILLQVLSDELSPLRALSAGEPDRWLGHARARPDARAAAAWRRWIAEEPVESARLVQEALIAVGGLTAPGSLHGG